MGVLIINFSQILYKCLQNIYSNIYNNEQAVNIFKLLNILNFIFLYYSAGR